jgi:NAD(P)-dependent dehydrogenase (short-subunit alcohol dehydrogenase family)
MQIDLNDVLVDLKGQTGALASAILQGLTSNGATIASHDSQALAHICIVVLPLLPQDGLDLAPALLAARSTAEAMHSRGHGRVVFVLSAAAGVPMRRHGAYSVQMAGALTLMRTLAMQCGPAVLVNAVGVGAIGDPIIAGDAAMLGHASVKRAGTNSEVVDTVLFFCDPANTYTTGQMLSVDGGWSAGYGRSF